MGEYIVHLGYLVLDVAELGVAQGDATFCMRNSKESFHFMLFRPMNNEKM
jgi:hypothetical protein